MNLRTAVSNPAGGGGSWKSKTKQSQDPSQLLIVAHSSSVKGKLYCLKIVLFGDCSKNCFRVVF